MTTDEAREALTALGLIVWPTARPFPLLGSATAEQVGDIMLYHDAFMVERTDGGFYKVTHGPSQTPDVMMCAELEDVVDYLKHAYGL